MRAIVRFIYLYIYGIWDGYVYNTFIIMLPTNFGHEMKFQDSNVNSLFIVRAQTLKKEKWITKWNEKTQVEGEESKRFILLLLFFLQFLAENCRRFTFTTYLFWSLHSFSVIFFFFLFFVIFCVCARVFYFDTICFIYFDILISIFYLFRFCSVCDQRLNQFFLLFFG